MNGVAWAVHQSKSRIDSRKLVSITTSPSVAVVSEMAPRWMTASSRRSFSHSINSEGGTTSASRRLARLRHLPSWPSTSHTATSRPASFNAATTFDPIKPAPPVTSNMSSPAVIVRQSFAPLPRGRQLKAFSSEVAFDSRQENASNQKDRTLGSDFSRTEVEIVSRGRRIARLYLPLHSGYAGGRSRHWASNKRYEH